MGNRHRIHDDQAGTGDDTGDPCVRGKYCAGRRVVIDQGIRVIEPARTYRAFCDRDRDHIQSCLGEGGVPALYRQLGARIGDKTCSDGPRVTGGGGTTPGPPINLGTEAFMRLVVDVVLSWEERVRTVARLQEVDTEASRHGDQTPALDRACRTLAAHVNTLLGLEPDTMRRYEDLHRREHLPEDAIGMVHPVAGWISYDTDLAGRHAGFEILNLHHRSLGRLGYKPQHIQLLSRCWECGGVGKLYRRDGTAGLADHVTCRACGYEYLGGRLAMLMADEALLEQARAARKKAS